MKIASLAVLATVSLLICFALVFFTLQKIAEDAPGAIGSMVAQAQVAYQKSHDAAIKGH